MKLSAILLCGGSGVRMGARVPKQYLLLRDKPIALYSYEMLTDSPQISEIIVVCTPEYRHLFPDAIYANPGERRQDSVYSGLSQASKTSDYILVHDGARPLLQKNDIQQVIEAGFKYGAATLSTPVKATIKYADSNQMVSKTLDRSTLYSIQTPQVLKKDILIQGFKKALEEKITVTDDVALAELISQPVKLVSGSSKNIKITTPEDLNFAASILGKKQKV